MNKWLVLDDTNTMIYTSLPLASENDYGIVRKIKDFDTVSDNEVISIDRFRDMYDIIHEKIVTLDQEIYDFLNTN
jgi:hypothetical protein